MSNSMKANLMLIVTAMIWGAAFVAQSAGMEYVGALTFQASRFLLGCVVLLPVVAARGRRQRRDAPAPGQGRRVWLAGALCGLPLFAGSLLQQYGLLYTSAGKSGFITALYVVLVPVAGLLLGRRAPLTVWLGTAMATAALYLLCVDEQLTVGRGELLTLGCAFCFTVQIMLVDHFSHQVDGVGLAFVQFLVCGSLSAVGMLLFESPTWGAIRQCWLPILYAGVLSCGVAYTLQILGQKYAKPTVASLLMSLESVFAVLFGALLLRERLQPAEYVGCALMFAAVVLAQLPQRKPAAQRKLK